MPQVGPLAAEVAAHAPRLAQVRLSRQRQVELVERYRAGALRRELAKAYGIGTGTVSGNLKRHHASRKLGLNEGEVEQAIERYEAGQSLAQIGEAFGVVAGTVRTALLRRGVTMRSTAGAVR